MKSQPINHSYNMHYFIIMINKKNSGLKSELPLILKTFE